MGARGPAPARSDQRRRRNEPATPTITIELDGEVEVPTADESWHPTAAAWYASLAQSGQARHYEPSDWQNAHYCAGLMSRSLTEEKVNAQLIAQVRGLMADLLVTEGARRRVGLEVVRKSATGEEGEQPSGNVTRMESRRRRVSGDS